MDVNKQERRIRNVQNDDLRLCGLWLSLGEGLSNFAYVTYHTTQLTYFIGENREKLMIKNNLSK